MNPPADSGRPQLTERLVVDLGAAFQQRAVYAAGHPQVQRAVRRALDSFAAWCRHEGATEVSLLTLEGQLLVDRQAIPEDSPWARGPLHGIPVILKDNIDTGDRMETTAGSRALAGSMAAKDAFLVGRLRAAGAVVLGKTNLSEWANFRSTRSTSGWSGRGGQVRNPYALDRNPCGSSSGTGAGVSANLAAGRPAR